MAGKSNHLEPDFATPLAKERFGDSVSREWLEGLKNAGGAPKNLHFLVLPSYSRWNPAAPLHPIGAKNSVVKKDLLAFPLGYAHIISSLQNFSNHNIEVLDPYAEYVDMRQLDLWLEHQYRDRNLTTPEYLLFGGMSTTWPVIKKAVEVMRQMFPTTKLVCGGTVANLHADLLLKDLGIDIAVIGEADFTIVDLFSRLNDYSNVQGIAYLDNSGKVVRTPPRPGHDLNDLPEPAWESFDIDEYLLSHQVKVGFSGLPFVASTGCPYACKFCYVPTGHSKRYLSTDKVVERMASMKERFGIDFISFNDDIMFVHKDWMWELGEKLLKADLDLMWICTTRVNLFSEKDKPLLELLKRTGLTRMSFGIESGSPKILKNMGKTGVNPERARSTLRLVRDVGIRATASMLLGYPGETPETIQESVDFCKENLLYPAFYILQPFPGTDVYENYVRQDYDERSYLELISDYREGEKIPVNLTNMSDEELLRNKAKAELEIQKTNFNHYASYYGWRTPVHMMRDAKLHLDRMRRGSMFVSP